MTSFKFPLILDGATGTMLQAAGMPQGVCPEQWILDNPDTIIALQSAYVDSGSNIVYAPTFGANTVKLEKFGLADRVEEINMELVALSRKAVGTNAYVAGDLSPLGLFLAPMGDSSFEEFVEVYRQQAAALEKAGVDLFVAETFMTLPELRAAILAIREVSDKPIFASITVEESGKTLMGTDVLTALTVVQNMGVSAFGLNCSTGPDRMVELIKHISPYAKIPLIVKPNAGLPHIENGKTVFDLCPQDFPAHTSQFLSLGVGALGGCCGTTPDHIRCLKDAVEEYRNEYQFSKFEENSETLIAATEKNYFFLDATVDISDEIEVTADFAEDLLDAEDEYSVLKLRINSEEALSYFIESQFMIQLPICIVSDSEDLFEKALREFTGRAIYDNSCDLSDSCIANCVKKYGLLVL